MDGSLILYTNDENGKKSFWHSTSHVMVQVLEQMYPGVKLTLDQLFLMGSTMISILKIKKLR
jgi:threonyl-tRNA synthetase